MTTRVENILRTVYASFDTPADRITTDLGLRDEFTNEVRRRTCDDKLTSDEAMRALLRLRKSGELPRLRR